MSKHSPGPWQWEYFMETLTIGDGEGRRVITFMPYAEKDRVSEADARLIAAAPELLEALKTHVGLDGGCARCCVLDNPGCLDLRAGMDCVTCEAQRELITRIERGE